MPNEHSHIKTPADQLLDVLLANIRVMIGAQALVVLAFGAYAFLARPTYRATAVVSQISSAPSDLGRFQALAGQLGLGGLAGLGFGSSSASDKHPIATMKSRQFLETFITKHDLMPKLYPDQDFNSAQPSPEQPSMWEAVTLILEDVLQIEENKVEGLITIAASHSDPELASSIVNDLIWDLNSTLRERDLTLANQNIAFIRNELENNSLIEMRQALYALLEAQLKTVMLASAQQEYVLRTIDKAQPPQEPESPRKLLLLITGLVVGFFAGVLSAIVAHLISARGPKASHRVRTEASPDFPK